MTDASRSALDDKIDELTTAFAASVAGLASGRYVRDGIVKEAVNGLIWDLYHAMPDQRYALADALEQMDGIVRAAIHDDGLKAAEAEAAEAAEAAKGTEPLAD